jgi:hypothetical protein
MHALLSWLRCLTKYRLGGLSPFSEVAKTVTPEIVPGTFLKRRQLNLFSNMSRLSIFGMAKVLNPLTTHYQPPASSSTD